MASVVIPRQNSKGKESRESVDRVTEHAEAQEHSSAVMGPRSAAGLKNERPEVTV